VNRHCQKFVELAVLLILAALGGTSPCCIGAAIPDKLVVLTFDDSVASHYSVVRPLLKLYGFSATFFITEGFSFRTNKKGVCSRICGQEIENGGLRAERKR